MATKRCYFCWVGRQETAGVGRRFAVRLDMNMLAGRRNCRALGSYTSTGGITSSESASDLVLASSPTASFGSTSLSLRYRSDERLSLLALVDLHDMDRQSRATPSLPVLVQVVLSILQREPAFRKGRTGPNPNVDGGCDRVGAIVQDERVVGRKRRFGWRGHGLEDKFTRSV
ncbi:hypothetical protein GSI_15125 [Ganoderma sinense ZZ0214-1]|uniref:Uncharacterized protein n=1 Tax=Ganoderma sinense ZZ0214-1 TaxID=1077348 RepID=A0A2G8RLP2_9APHY|nr:hypothetical protein GSI_15125 [Ganoderma sinense ZZ0214-1]